MAVLILPTFSLARHPILQQKSGQKISESKQEEKIDLMNPQSVIDGLGRFLFGDNKDKKNKDKKKDKAKDQSTRPTRDKAKPGEKKPTVVVLIINNDQYEYLEEAYPGTNFISELRRLEIDGQPIDLRIVFFEDCRIDQNERYVCPWQPPEESGKEAPESIFILPKFHKDGGLIGFPWRFFKGPLLYADFGGGGQDKIFDEKNQPKFEGRITGIPRIEQFIENPKPPTRKPAQSKKGPLIQPGVRVRVPFTDQEFFLPVP